MFSFLIALMFALSPAPSVEALCATNVTQYRFEVDAAGPFEVSYDPLFQRQRWAFDQPVVKIPRRDDYVVYVRLVGADASIAATGVRPELCKLPALPDTSTE